MKKAFLIVDMINPLDFPEGKKLLRQALPVARIIKKAQARMRRARIPIIYVNDCFGRLKDDWKQVYEFCSDPKHPGSKLCQILKPGPKDYFILKPKHSGFFGTSLEVLLKDLGVEELIITGIAGNICVLFTVNDAYMRGYKIHVPKNAIASNSRKDNDFVLRIFSKHFKIKTEKIRE